MTHIISQSMTFSLFPEEIKSLIFNFYIEADGDPEARRVCKDWYGLFNKAMGLKWEALKIDSPPGFTDFNFKMRKIEDNLNENEKQSASKYVCLFKKLNLELKLLGIEIPKGTLRASWRHFSLMQARLYQKKLEISLKAIWSRVLLQVHLLVPFTNDYKEISAWIRDPQTKRIRELIEDLDLSDLGIHFIPDELGFFPKLKSLNLANNYIDTLPAFLGNLELSFLSLAGNDLQELPKGFASWPLKKVNFKDNPLQESALAIIAQIAKR